MSRKMEVLFRFRHLLRHVFRLLNGQEPSFIVNLFKGFVREILFERYIRLLKVFVALVEFY